MKYKYSRVIIVTIVLLLISYVSSVVIVRLLNVNTAELIVLIVILVTLVEGLVVSIGKVNNNNDLQEALEEQTKIRSSIIGLTQKMTSIHSNTELHDMILRTAVDVLPNATMGSIMIIRDKEYLKFTSVVGFKLEELQAIELKLEDSYLYHETKGKVNKTIIVDNAQKVNSTIPGEANKEMVNTTNTELINSTITSPLFIDGKLYGMMNVDSETKRAFSENDVDLMNFFANEVVKVIKLYDTIEENNRLSKFDPLTNLYNRRYLHHRLKRLTQDSNIFTLVSIDINNLKEVNDKYGHDLGDELLMSFVSGFRKHLDREDLFSRYGGDEFIVVFDNKNKDVINKKFKEVILPMFADQVVHEDMKDIRVSFSYGITSYPEDAVNYEKLMIKADQLMYSNKRAFHLKKSMSEES